MNPTGSGLEAEEEDLEDLVAERVVSLHPAQNPGLSSV